MQRHAWLWVVGALGWPILATAQDAGEAAASGAGAEASADTYLVSVYDGVRHIVLRDAEGAVSLLRAATQAAPERPEAYCHLAEAERMAGRPLEAIKAYQSCRRFAETASEARYARMAQVGEAMTQEATPEGRDEARALYTALSASEQPGSPAQQLAASRLQVLDAHDALDEAYAPVRERIAAREAEKAPESTAKKR